MSERVVAAPSSPCPTVRWRGCCSSWHRLFASSWTSAGHVAEKKSMCLSARQLFPMVVTSPENPKSSILSASSSTKYVTRPRDMSPLFMKSISRPGVPAMIAQPFDLLSCSPRCLPPYTHSAQMPPECEPCLDCSRSFPASVAICAASSRVGASTRAMGVDSPLGTGSCASMCTTAGIRNASVLPLPVRAMPIRSRPPRMIGRACAWMGIGRSRFASLRACWRYSGRHSSSSKSTIGGYAPARSSTTTSSSTRACCNKASSSSPRPVALSRKTRWKGPFEASPAAFPSPLLSSA
mmetsp:Transcript_716/g.2080  ORF Transcript_716/g.2080 Transcript_716/m.2080 type:complete len:294 (-) Transcript_716:476-1357(-)